MPQSTSSHRPLVRVETTAPAAPGFIGAGHMTVEVIHPTRLAATDPFVLLMDDRLEIPERRQIGGAHPHAGLETVTLILDGAMADRDEGDLSAGDVIWMTAGRGIVHNEAVEMEGRARVLQLWIALSAHDRALKPRFEVIHRDDAPLIRRPGALARLYSGVSGSLQSATRNRVPVTMIDLALDPGALFLQDLPRTFNGFFYMLEGSVRVEETIVHAGQVGWFAPGGAEALEVRAGPNGARLVLYAGLPIGEPLFQQGPFVAGSVLEVTEFHRRFRAGEFMPMSRLAREPSQ